MIDPKRDELFKKGCDTVEKALNMLADFTEEFEFEIQGLIILQDQKSDKAEVFNL